MADCVCGFPDGENVDNCERCKLLARIAELEAELAELRDDFNDDDEDCDDDETEWLSEPVDDGNKGDELRDRAKDDVGRVW